MTYSLRKMTETCHNDRIALIDGGTGSNSPVTHGVFPIQIALVMANKKYHIPSLDLNGRTSTVPTLNHVVIVVSSQQTGILDFKTDHQGHRYLVVAKDSA